MKKQDPMTKVLARFRRRDTTGFADSWVGIEPTFQSRKSVEKWHQMAADGTVGEDAYFLDPYMLGTQKAIAKEIVKRYRKRRKKQDPRCMFATVEREEELDQWGVTRQNLQFRWPDDQGEQLPKFEVKFTLDPETFEYSIKPVPLVWFYDQRFVDFVEDFLFAIPQRHGLSASVCHGGAQFSQSAKTFMTGSLLADDIATKLNHPELSLWIMDWPNPDDRAFRATRPRFEAFRRILEAYWAGAFHPRAIGELTVERVWADRDFGPAPAPPRGLMDAKTGPKGSAREVFLTNFAFGRAVRLLAQAVHPGYWQSAHPKAEGYRPDQIMRYSEGNLNRLQIAGELHVKSGKVLDEERVPAFDAPLDIGMLYEEASWEDRGQMGRTSGRDFIEALLLDVHAQQWLQRHPHVKVLGALRQDQLLADGEATVRKHAGAAALRRLHAEARTWNLEMSAGRVRSDWIEPETLLWAAWKALPAGGRAAIADEIVAAFVRRVEQAGETDPRPSQGDRMEWHRHRVHPILWQALAGKARGVAKRELAAWEKGRKKYLARRPIFSHVKSNRPPWE